MDIRGDGITVSDERVHDAGLLVGGYNRNGQTEGDHIKRNSFTWNLSIIRIDIYDFE